MSRSGSIIATALDNETRRRSSLTSLGNTPSKQKPNVDIILYDEQKDCFVPSFTTLERIQGKAAITSPVDVSFDDIHITFQGSAKVFVEKLATSAPTNPRTQAFHNFLRLSQPIEESALPPDRILRAGRTYKFGFVFVVPERLLPQACQHDTDSPTVRDAHLALPPSFGDPMMAGDGKALLDDLAPDNTIISYSLRVYITKKLPGARSQILSDCMRKLRIIPAVDEAAPLRVLDGCEDDYVLRRTKSLKKGTFKGKLGRLSMEAAQPKAATLHGRRSESRCRVTTMATVNLRFDPQSEVAKPPKLGSLVTKLRVGTFFSSVPLKTFPRKAQNFFFDSQRGFSVESLPLSSRCVQSAEWRRHEPLARRDSAVSIPDAAPIARSPSSGSSSGSSADPASGAEHRPDAGAGAGPPFYTATILVPIDLPTTSRSFVPTFHSCLISRVYALELALSARPPAASVAAPTTLRLKLPLQIAAEGNADATPMISDEEAASIARRDAEDVFLPRSVAPPRGGRAVDPAVVPRDLRGARGSVFNWTRVEGNGSGGEGSPERRGGRTPMEGSGESPPEYDAMGSGRAAGNVVTVR